MSQGNIFEVDCHQVVEGKKMMCFLTFSVFFLNFFIYLLFGAALGLCCCVWLSLVVASGGYSSLWRVGFSLWWLLLLWSSGSRRVSFSSCGK